MTAAKKTARRVVQPAEQNMQLGIFIKEFTENSANKQYARF
jgi:hypothetical protein